MYIACIDQCGASLVPRSPSLRVEGRSGNETSAVHVHVKLKCILTSVVNLFIIVWQAEHFTACMTYKDTKMLRHCRVSLS